MRVILLLGMPRCGSTWVGGALSEYTASKYIHEPLNPSAPESLGGYTYRYLPPEASEPQLLAHLRSRMWGGGRLKGLLQLGKVYLIKEVESALTCQYLCANFPMTPVLLLRHPCGVVNSFKSFGWTGRKPLTNLRSQPDFTDRFTSEYADLIDEALEPEQDTMLTVSVLWGVVYTALLKMANAHQDPWPVIRHETLCADPDAEYSALVKRLGLRVSDRGRAFLNSHNRKPDPAESRYVPYRNSAQEPDKWKSKLSSEHISCIVSAAKRFPIYQQFYGDRSE